MPYIFTPTLAPASSLFNAPPQIMGILNVTPDSFSDGGRFNSQQQALAHARQMIAEGATIIDVGGESTRPYADSVSETEELARVIPIIEALRAEFPVHISIDSNKAQVIKEAVAAGADLINDVMALQNEGCLAIAAAAPASVKICLMHSQGNPRTMQNNPQYEDVTNDVYHFLQQRIETAIAAGIAQSRLIIDVGFGFGKTVSHNLQLMQQLHRFHALNCPMLVGTSRKSMIGLVLDKPVNERLYGGLALTSMAVMQGAQIIRTHDVAATADVVKMTWRVMQEEI